MTQQFKFGDRLRNLDGKEFIYLRAECGSCVVVSILGNVHHLRGEFFELVPHPDTSRLDWMIMREHADDLRAEDKVFVLQTYRENIDIRIRLAAKLAAEAV